MKKRTLIAAATALILCVSLFVMSVASAEQATFSDVKTGDWFYNDVNYVFTNKLMNGTSASAFSPAGATTRAMIVTILWRLEGEPVESGKEFKDVAAGAYYFDAVAWASNNGIVGGYDEFTFGPNDTATREQLAAIMYRYASYKKFDTSNEAELGKYADQGQISPWATQPIRWANANGLINGTSETTISPKANVQRCQIAAILRRLCEKFEIIKAEVPKEEIKEEVKEENKEEPKEELPAEEPKEEVKEEIKEEPKEAEDDKGPASEDNKKEENKEPVEENTPSDPTPDVDNGKLKIVADNVSAAAGENVQVAIKLKNNPGVLGMTLSLQYDESKCTLESVENGSAVSSILNLTTSKTLASGMNFIWDGLELSAADIKDGDLVVLNFKIKEGAAAGKTPVTIKCSGDEVFDNDLNSVPLAVVNGSIDIK